MYLKELFLRDASFFLFAAVLAFFIHAIAPNKYVGYFAFIAFLILKTFIWRPLNVATYLVRFGMRSSVTNCDSSVTCASAPRETGHALGLLFAGCFR